MRRFIRALVHAAQGITLGLQQERHLRFHGIAAAGVVGLALWLPLQVWEWTVLLLCIGMVFAAELMNGALERVADVAHPDTHPLIKAAKDMSAGAVLVLAVVSLVVGLLIFGPKLIG